MKRNSIFLFSGAIVSLILLIGFPSSNIFERDLNAQITFPPSSVFCFYHYNVQISGISTTLYSVTTPGEGVGWAAGAGGVIRRTTDGGLNWINGNPNPGTITGDIYNIHAVDANIAFVTTSPSATFIYKTVNGGANWSQVFIQPGGFIDAIEMISPLIGYAQGDPVGGTWTILTTVDGGNTWARIPTEPADEGSEAGWSNSFQILGTNIWFGTNNTRVYRSTNLGSSWTFSVTPGTLHTYGIHFNNSMEGVAGGNAGVYTTDGGATYTSILVPGVGYISGITGGNNDIWLVRSANIHRSSDNGQTWIGPPVYTGTGALLDIDTKITVNKCSVGWAIGASGQIVRLGDFIDNIHNIENEIPSSYLLKQNFPNPFNPTTNIYFAIPQSGLVTLKIFDIAGREISTLVNEVRAAGSYIVDFNASDLSSGAYFYRIESGNFVDSKKMMLIK
jgi:photosystem II stability/assembly factor-like uncharacterized protein